VKTAKNSKKPLKTALFGGCCKGQSCPETLYEARYITKQSQTGPQQQVRVFN